MSQMASKHSQSTASVLSDVKVRDTKYRKVLDHLYAEIHSGLMQPGAPLPTDLDLSTSLGMSRNTVRHAFDKNDGNLGTSGAVVWLFERRAVVLVSADGVDEDDLTLAAAEGGADDVALDGSQYQIVAQPAALTSVREAVEGAGFTVDSAELTMVPKTTVEVADEVTAKKVLRLMDQLEENDDVQDVFANFDIPEPVLEVIAS